MYTINKAVIQQSLFLKTKNSKISTANSAGTAVVTRDTIAAAAGSNGKNQQNQQQPGRRGASTRGWIPWILPSLVIVSTLYHGYVEIFSLDTARTLRSSASTQNTKTDGVVIESQIMTKANILKKKRLLDSNITEVLSSSSSNDIIKSNLMDTLFNMAPVTSDNNDDSKKKNIHIVFSTSCKLSQDCKFISFNNTKIG
jgi:hypothetical protein